MVRWSIRLARKALRSGFLPVGAVPMLGPTRFAPRGIMGERGEEWGRCDESGGRFGMKVGNRAIRLEDIGREEVMEGADMRASILTLAAGQRVPWHYHSTIADVMVCLSGPMVVETRAPRAKRILNPGDYCAVPPMTAHCVYGVDDGPCRYLILQGVGEYDNFAVGG